MNKWIVGTAVAALVAIPALAQMGGMDHHRMKGPQTRAEVAAEVKSHFAAVDTNKDGTITREEADAFRAERMAKRADRMFAEIDTDKNGQISRAEFDAHHKGMGERKGEGMHHGPGKMMRGGGAEMFDKADVNADGKLTFAEVDAKAMAMFDTADADKNGIVTLEERHAAMAAWMGDRMQHVHGDPHVDEKK